MKLLIIGGSGFVSGTLAKKAVDEGHRVWTVTRGLRPIPSGVTPIVVDRLEGAAFEKAVRGADEKWDLVVDCICYHPEVAELDAKLFLADDSMCDSFVLISTDFVYHPESRRFPQDEAAPRYLEEGYGYEKRRSELVISERAAHKGWTILRPCHIYGPGSLLGCLPDHGRDSGLLDRIREGVPLRLVGGGRFLQQPIYAADLADTILSAAGNSKAHGSICNIAGPEIIESKRYYEIIGEIVDKRVQIEEISLDEYSRDNPEKKSFLCHRIYDLGSLSRAGLAVPTTGCNDALEAQVNSLL